MPKMWVNRDLDACVNIAYALTRGVGVVSPTKPAGVGVKPTKRWKPRSGLGSSSAEDYAPVNGFFSLRKPYI